MSRLGQDVGQEAAPPEGQQRLGATHTLRFTCSQNESSDPFHLHSETKGNASVAISEPSAHPVRCSATLLRMSSSLPPPGCRTLPETGCRILRRCRMPASKKWRQRQQQWPSERPGASGASSKDRKPEEQIGPRSTDHKISPRLRRRLEALEPAARL